MTDVSHTLRGRAAIVSAATAGIGRVGPDRHFMELTAEAALSALAGAGIPPRNVDGLFGVSMSRTLFAVDFAEYLGIDPTFVDTTQLGGGSFEAHCLSAAAALELGLCRVALICFGATTRSQRGPWPNVREFDPHIDAYQAEGLHTYALAAARHMYQYGTTREHLAEAALSARRWAQLNPRAFRREPLTREEVLAAKPISTPLTSADCCLVTDGAAAVVMMRADEAAAHARRPAYFLGGGVALSHTNPSQMPDLTSTAARTSGERAYRMARMGPTDMQCVQLYDAFTINVLLFLEDLGFCRKGDGGPFISDGRIAPGGALPVNTNGGGLSCVHPGMYGLFMLVEAFEQLAGLAGERQVPGVGTVLCHGNGGNLSAQVTTIWGSRDAL